MCKFTKMFFSMIMAFLIMNVVMISMNDGVLAAKSFQTKAVNLSGGGCRHTYKAATCTSGKKCTKCGATMGSARGHSYKAATCTSPKKCTRCGVTTGRALGHNYTKTVVITKATCKSTGVKAIRCSRCNAEQKRMPIMALSHNYKKATCTTPEKCTNCGTTRGNALGHDYSKTVVVKKATCSSTGIKAIRCSRCKLEQKRMPIMVTGHKYVYKINGTKDHTVSCANCSYSVTNPHVLNASKTCVCGFVKIVEGTCKPNKLIAKHDIVKLCGKVYNTQHQVIRHCNDCNVDDLSLPNDPHKFDDYGKCECGKYDETKDITKLKCTPNKMQKKHATEMIDVKEDKTTSKQHVYRLYCKMCNVTSDLQRGTHDTNNSEGKCFCGYIDLTKVEKGYEIKKKNDVSYAQSTEEDNKIILLAFGGDGENIHSLKQSAGNFIINDPRITAGMCNYAYMTKPSNGWTSKRDIIVDMTVDYIKEVTGCGSLEEAADQGYQVVLYAYSSGGEMLDPVWRELVEQGLVPTAEINVEGYVRDRVTDQQILDHANGGTNVTICSVTNGDKDRISYRTEQAGKRLDGAGENGTIEHEVYKPDEEFKNDNYTHGQAGRQSADSVVAVIEELKNGK